MPITVLGQETTIIKNNLTDAVSERISVLKSDKKTREGVYLAFFRGTTKALAKGKYTNNVKTGWWDFFNANNQLIQRYDYTNKQLLFEAPEDSTSNCRYVVDDTIKINTKTTKPVRIGDRYYGYINYLKIFKLPPDLRGIEPDLLNVTLELLISPYGRLADYQIHLVGTKLTYRRTLGFNLDLLSDEDKTFLPATIEGKPVACRIFIKCYLTPCGQIDFD